MKSYASSRLLALLLVALTVAPPALAGKVTSSIRLAVEGEVLMDNDGPIVMLAGTVHAVAQVIETDDETLCGFRVNLAGLSGNDDVDGAWVGVGAIQHPPNPCLDPESGSVVAVVLPFTLIPLGEGHPPDPGRSPEILLTLAFDADGRLAPDRSFATIGLVGR